MAEWPDVIMITQNITYVIKFVKKILHVSLSKVILFLMFIILVLSLKKE